MPSLRGSMVCIGIALLLVGGCRLQTQQDRPTVYAVNRCEGTPAGWSPHGSEYGELMAHNTLVTRPSGFAWNGVAISAATLRNYLEQMSRLNPRPNIQVVFDERTDCGLVNQIRALIADKLTCHSKGQCVEYSGAEYQTQLAHHAVY